MKEMNEVFIARSVAIFLVVALHASGAFFLWFHDNWTTTVFYSSLTRQCIGMFFIITGYLYYGKDIPVKSHITTGVTKLLIPFIFWWIAYLIYNSLINGAKFKSIFQPSEVHLWFMYSYILIYAFIPLFSKSVEKIPTLYLLALVMALFYAESIVPVTSKLIDGVTWFDYKFISHYGMYILIGFIMRKKRNFIMSINPAILAFAVILGSASTYYLTMRWSVHVGHPDQFFFKNTAPNVVLTAVLTFALCMSISKKLSSGLVGFTKNVANASFGIYFVHFFFVRELRLGYSPENAYYMIPILSILYFVISYIIIVNAKKIKYINRVI